MSSIQRLPEMNIETIDTTRFPDNDGHEQVLRCTDAATGLDAVIAIHNRNLGPALGGCRIRAYGSTEAAVTDALRLSRGMTYKSALAGLPLGGGKSVINIDTRLKTDEIMEAMGDFVESLNGAYIVAEDSGSSVADMQVIGRRTDCVAGVKEKRLSDGSVVDGDPSRSTAYGVFNGIQSAVRFRLGAESLSGVHVAIQGVGHVGSHLAKHLRNAGAQLTLADIDLQRVHHVADELGAAVVDVDAIHRAPADVFAPCALGSVVTFDTLGEMPAQIIAGAANNQLATDAAGYEAFARGKLYAPDYVINAGGIIDIFYERDGYDHERVTAHVERIGRTLTEIFEASRRDQEPTHVIADRMARQRFADEKQSNVA